MKVYIVCEYLRHEDKEQGTESLELYDIHAVTTDRYLAELIRDGLQYKLIKDALQYKHDPKGTVSVYKVREFKVYGII